MAYMRGANLAESVLRTPSCLNAPDTNAAKVESHERCLRGEFGEWRWCGNCGRAAADYLPDLAFKEVLIDQKRRIVAAWMGDLRLVIWPGAEKVAAELLALRAEVGTKTPVKGPRRRGL